jgi:hypothetical protein
MGILPQFGWLVRGAMDKASALNKHRVSASRVKYVQGRFMYRVAISVITARAMYQLYANSLDQNNQQTTFVI